MQLEQGFDLPVAPAQAWPAFADIELLVACLPGASLTGPAVEGEWPLRFDVKLGPMSAGFVGAGRSSLDHALQSGGFEGAAVDKRSNSRVKGAVAFSVAAQAAGSRVLVTVDYTLTGTLAQFSRGGLVRELASALTAQFAANLSARLQAQAVADTVMASDSPSPAEPGGLAAAPVMASDAPSMAPPAAAPLSATSLLLQVLKTRCQQLLTRLLRRRSA